MYSSVIEKQSIARSTVIPRPQQLAVRIRKRMATSGEPNGRQPRSIPQVELTKAELDTVAALTPWPNSVLKRLADQAGSLGSRRLDKTFGTEDSNLSRGGPKSPFRSTESLQCPGSLLGLSGRTTEISGHLPPQTP